METRNQQAMTFEQIDAHINNANLEQYESMDGQASDAQPAGDATAVLSQVCSVYKIVKPILNGILLIPFIPEKWKKALRVFTKALDSICASNT